MNVARVMHRRVETAKRLPSVDACRGLAIVLMVLDHSAAMLLNTKWSYTNLTWLLLPIRYTVTRASLPLFMLCTGVLLASRPLSGPRLHRVALVAVAVNVGLVALPFGVHVPEVLAVWVLVMMFGPVIRSYPVLVGCVGAVQVFTWPIPWNGYQPGLLAVCVALGVLGGPLCLDWAARLPSWLSSVGRRPLGWYCGHLAVLAVVYSILT